MLWLKDLRYSISLINIISIIVVIKIFKWQYSKDNINRDVYEIIFLKNNV